MKLLVLDNYDSFTYNLVQYLRERTPEGLDVHRNDQIALDAVDAYDCVVLSPGPGVPSAAGIMPALLERYAHTKAILGVCLGHQAIGEAFGGELVNLERVYHGVDTDMTVLDPTEVLFRDLPTTFRAGRYHSWAVRRENLPGVLTVTAEDEHGAIMAFRHRHYNVRGVQFHPESIMTEHGKTMVGNWLTEQRRILAARRVTSMDLAG